MLPTLYGDRVVLRPISDRDTDLVVAWRNTAAVRDNFIFQERFTPEMHRHWLETRVKGGDVVQYIIEEKTTGIPVGSVYFRDINATHRNAEYGIFIGEACARGKGFGIETTRLFCDFGFSCLKFHRISLRVLSRNEAAIRSYQSAGFHVEGIFKDMVSLQGKWNDVVFMAQLEPEVG